MKQINAIVRNFVGFPELGGIAELSQTFLRGTETFQLLIGGFFEIIDIPLRKCIFKNPKVVKSRKKKRVFSVEILTQNLSTKWPVVNG